MAVQNGKIPSSQLKRVQGIITRIYLLTPSAYAWIAMRDACRKATGVTLKITAPYGGYRSLAAQWYMWYHRGTSTTGVVAYPGVSVHGWGRAVDINNWGTAAVWLRDNAHRFGFRRTIWNEAWHFEHSGGSGSSGTTGTVTPTTTTEESDMKIAIVADEGYTPYLIFPDRTYTPLGAKTLEHCRNGKPKHGGPFGQEFEFTAEEWARFRKYLQLVPLAPAGAGE